MSKSRYSKTKAAGLLVGMTRYKKQVKSSMAGAGIALADNRQMRRARKG